MTMKKFPWYDSGWLSSYVRAKAYIQVHQPQTLAEFVTAFDVLRTSPDFSIRQLPRLFSTERHEQIRHLIKGFAKQDVSLYEMLTFGRAIVHDQSLLDEIQTDLAGQVSEWVGEQVEPSYNFISLYNNLGVCRPHMDAPSAKWTIDYCIEQSAPWPIHFSQVRAWPEDWSCDEGDWENRIKTDPGNHFLPHILQEGGAILFGGSSQWHYRDRIAQRQANNFCHLAFFHFIPTGTRALTEPENWAAMFNIPELNQIIIRPRNVNEKSVTGK